MRYKQIIITLLASMLSISSAYADIRFWTTEEQPDRLAKQQSMAKAFEDAIGIGVDVVPVTEKDYGSRAAAAYSAGNLSDVIYLPLQYALPWYEESVLDADAASEVIDEINPATFAPGALNMAKVPEGYTAVPVDGWTQMVVYRKDLFEQNDLASPTNYANGRAMATRARESFGGALTVPLENVSPTWWDIASAQYSAAMSASGVMDFIYQASGRSHKWQTIIDTIRPTLPEDMQWRLPLLPFFSEVLGWAVPEISDDEFVRQVKEIDTAAYLEIVQRSEGWARQVESDVLHAHRLAELGYGNADSIMGDLGVFLARMVGAALEPVNLALIIGLISASGFWAARRRQKRQSK